MRKVSDDELAGALEILRHGGRDSVDHFTEVARVLFSQGGPEQLRDWVSVAAPALPEWERNEIISILMQIMLGGGGKVVDAHDEHRTLH
ncbi:MAG: hypothetical protein ACK8QZ_11590 [Anaerolineales bacterium]